MIIDFDSLEQRILDSKFENLCSLFKDYDKELILNYECHPYFRREIKTEGTEITISVYYFPGKIFNGNKKDGLIDSIIREINPNFIGEVYIINAEVHSRTGNPPKTILTTYKNNLLFYFIKLRFGFELEYSFFSGDSGYGFAKFIKNDPITYILIEDRAIHWNENVVYLNSRIESFVAFSIGTPYEVKKKGYNELKDIVTLLLYKILAQRSS